LWLNGDNSKHYKNIESYLIRSAKNLCLDRIKHKNVVLRNSENINRLSNNSTEPVGDKKEISEIIKAIINELPKKQKMIIHLRDVEGYRYDEIYDATGIELNAIRVNLSRARKTVKQELIKTMNYGL
jgi:RNA polymerase sigma-70 factor (ECF subfamily)